ncbi:MAG: hypothetical protein QXN87_05460 [Candidatus Bathyarchaeia archaeon]
MNRRELRGLDLLKLDGCIKPTDDGRVFLVRPKATQIRALADIESPQRILEEYFDGLAQSLMGAVEAVIEGLKEAGANVE